MVFHVLTDATENNEELESRIQSRFPENFYQVGSGDWLVSHVGTAKELYIKLFPEPEFPLPKKNIVIFGISGYWGIAPQDMWEWITARQGVKTGQ